MQDLMLPGLDDTIAVFMEEDQKLLDEYKKDGKFDITRCYSWKESNIENSKY